MPGNIVTTGPAGGTFNRLEIHDFVQNDKFFSLYVQALDATYSRANSVNSRPDLYFQIGGIHGLPYALWDNAGIQVQPTGYCTHGTVLFPTWHRPYVSLVEQIINQHAVDIANTYKVDQQAWKNAASSLRQPYWDWAQPDRIVLPPEVIEYEEVNITKPDGTRGLVVNPFRRFPFTPGAPDYFPTSPPFNFRQYNTTVRYPKTDGTDDIDLLRSTLANSQSDVTSKTYNMLTQIHTWPQFSNHMASNQGVANSLESIHDQIHVITGGGGQGGAGHMSSVPVAAFDPIFFLHHCNVDRLLSLWSALNPGVWVTPGSSQSGTITLRQNARVDTNTGLTPFRRTSSTFWPSSAVTTTSSLGYSYPEFNGLDMNNPNAVKTAISQAVNRLYGSAVSDANDFSSNSRLTKFKSTSVQANNNTSLLGDGEFWEWTVRIRFQQLELGNSFIIPIFLGDVPDDPKQWLVSRNLVGAGYAFVNGNAGQADTLVENFVHIHAKLLQLAGLESLEPQIVKPFLKSKLNWGVLNLDGTAAELNSLHVDVFSTKIHLPIIDILIPKKNPIFHRDITEGRKGGYRGDQTSSA